jgi:hypothetical protein
MPRSSYLRQIAQPLVTSTPLLTSPRRWPVRAGEERVALPAIVPATSRPTTATQASASSHAGAAPATPPTTGTSPADSPTEHFDLDLPRKTSAPLQTPPRALSPVAPSKPQAVSAPVLPTDATWGDIVSPTEADAPIQEMVAQPQFAAARPKTVPAQRELQPAALAPAEFVVPRRSGTAPQERTAMPQRSLTSSAKPVTGEVKSPSVKIGSIEVRVTPPAPAVTPRPSAAIPAASSSPGRLSRGFISAFGLRQG